MIILPISVILNTSALVPPVRFFIPLKTKLSALVFVSLLLASRQEPPPGPSINHSKPSKVLVLMRLWLLLPMMFTWVVKGKLWPIVALPSLPLRFIFTIPSTGAVYAGGVGLGLSLRSSDPILTLISSLIFTELAVIEISPPSPPRPKLVFPVLW